MPHRRLAPALLLALAACSAATSVRDGGVTATPDQPFTLRAGETAALDASVEGPRLRVTFLGVTDDSRCAEDVQCVWQGDARVALHLATESAAVDTAAHTTLHRDADPRLGGWAVSVSGVAPNARSGRVITPTDYRATLVVSRAR